VNHTRTTVQLPVLRRWVAPRSQPCGHRFILICRRPTRTIAAISSHIEALGGHMAELVVSLETISMPLVLGLSHESLDRMSGAACFPTLN